MLQDITNKETKRPPLQPYKEVHRIKYLRDRTVNSILKSFNVGIITGKVNNLTVIDLDFYKPNFYFPFNIDELTKKTYSQKSASGGYHLFYQYDKDLKQRNEGNICIDVKNDGGYVLFSGSSFGGNQYEALNDLYPSKIPQEIKDFLLNNGFNKKEKPNESKFPTKSQELLVNTGFNKEEKPVEIKFPTKVQEFFDLLLNNVNQDFFLTGGAICHLLEGKKPKDYDIVVTSLSEIRKFLKQQQIMSDHILIDEIRRIQFIYKNIIFDIYECKVLYDFDYCHSVYNIRQKSLTIVPNSNFMNETKHFSIATRTTKNIRKGYKTPQDLKKYIQEIPLSQYELELKKNYKSLCKEFNFHDKRNFEKMEMECFGHVRTKNFFSNQKIFFIRGDLCDFTKLSHCCILCEKKENFEKYEPYLPILYMLYFTNNPSYMIHWLQNYRLCLLKACNIEIDTDFEKTEKDFDIHYHFKTIEPTLFLDIDGVLSNDGHTIDENLFEHFAPLIPNSNIVITSTWRLFQHKREILTQLFSNSSIHFTENKNPFYDSDLEVDWKLPNDFFQQTISTQYNIMKKIYKDDIPYKELCEHLEDFEIKFDKFLIENNIPYDKNKKTIFEILRDANSNVMLEYVIENGHSEQLIKILPKKYISDDSQLIYDEFLKIKTCDFSLKKVLPTLSFENKMLWKLEFYAEIHRWIPRKQHAYIRELEIQEYMRDNIVGKYVIIDDLPMTDKEYFICCEKSPFSRDHAIQVEEKLQKQDDFIQDISFEISNGYFFQRSEYSKTLFEIDDDMISFVQPYLGESSEIWLETVYQDFYNKHEVFWQQFNNVNPSYECLKFIINKYSHQIKKN